MYGLSNGENIFDFRSNPQKIEEHFYSSLQ